ncbi:MAG: hypothetical protein AB7V39_21495 [Nitrospiraceae bacterium]
MDNRIERIINSHANALDDLPIVERLLFVKNLITDRKGETNIAENDMMIEMATRVLSDVISVLKKNIRAANLRDNNL